MFYGNFQGENGQRFKDALALLRTCFGEVYANDNLIALQRSAGFRRDPAFVEAVRKHAATEQERSLLWRLHTQIWCARHALDLDGDFVECGVYTGYCMGVMADYLGFGASGRQMYLYDTFEGIPEAYNSEGRSNRVYAEQNAANPDTIHDIARDRFAALPNVHLVRGIVPDTFAEACPDRIAFLHVDMNSAASEIAALEVLFDRVVAGGFILFDDYGWSGYRAQKEAEDVWLAARGHFVLELPTGQGLCLKRPDPEAD